ncbi:hypothetical protein [Kitasatospora sp. NPDC088783]|uniref:hypothetical protein n=1 Tax=Kitasatospora sp. NPDC088783 TaxID=3364077 RepID=UPI0037F1342D
MTTFEIIDQAPRITARHPGFLTQVERVLPVAASMAEKYAEMRLPERVTVRLLTPEGVVAAMRRHADLVSRGIAASYEGQHRAAARRTVLDAYEGLVRLQRENWFIVKGRMLQDEDTGPYLAFVPAVHTALRSSDRLLTQIAGHELVHIMQQRLPDLEQLFFTHLTEQRLGLRAPQDIIPLPLIVEGHALWVHRQIVTALGGEGDDTFPGDPLPVPWMRRRLRAVRPQQERMRQQLYHRGLPFMNTLAATGGPQLIASIFDHVDRLPGVAELGDPQLWLQRHPHPAAATLA